MLKKVLAAAALAYLIWRMKQIKYNLNGLHLLDCPWSSRRNRLLNTTLAVGCYNCCRILHTYHPGTGAGRWKKKCRWNHLIHFHFFFSYRVVFLLSSWSVFLLFSTEEVFFLRLEGFRAEIWDTLAAASSPGQGHVRPSGRHTGGIWLARGHTWRGWGSRWTFLLSSNAGRGFTPWTTLRLDQDLKRDEKLIHANRNEDHNS